ncbi:protein FAR-RED IMPAIRED RESPONSE 1-like [Helianthus annuus]|uniref:protein FAR-RED IMPAIRED RESPONSE 1-like n=1 Tax=Helianthus annuus TaxID=4232 RepID=UPI000B8F9660|nr:protein FAR-RED IMPAIRED RESPONSE 1-like [Helianthus annuus]
MDNHRKCVTIGAGMIAKENIESFTFLLEIFLKAFKKQPNIIVTDQDPAMKVAVSKVFTESKHRLCTWHITNKLPTKVCGDVENNAEFKSKFHKLVWSIYTRPEQFEKRWRELMEDTIFWEINGCQICMKFDIDGFHLILKMLNFVD